MRLYHRDITTTASTCTVKKLIQKRVGMKHERFSVRMASLWTDEICRRKNEVLNLSCLKAVFSSIPSSHSTMWILRISKTDIHTSIDFLLAASFNARESTQKKLRLKLRSGKGTDCICLWTYKTSLLSICSEATFRTQLTCFSCFIVDWEQLEVVIETGRQ